jgi:hypothetical protein
MIINLEDWGYGELTFLVKCDLVFNLDFFFTNYKMLICKLDNMLSIIFINVICKNDPNIINTLDQD